MLKKRLWLTTLDSFGNMNTTYTDAIKEVATQAPIDNAMIETLNMSHPTGGAINIVNARESFSGYANNTDQNKIFYQPSNFEVKLPESSKEGVQYLSLVIANSDGKAGEFLSSIPVQSDYPIIVVYRIYLGLDIAGQARPQNDPPLSLDVLNVEITPFTIQLRASFKSIINTKYPSERYTLEKFPALGN